MHLSLDMIRRTDDGVLICAPQGEVLLRRTRQGITAKYRKGPLVNGTATAFAEKAKQSVLNYAQELKPPWTTGRGGCIHINNHQQFYEQTFSAPSYALETLKRWSQK